MEGSPFGQTEVSDAADRGSVEGYSVVDLADLLLLAVATGRADALLLAPEASSTSVRYERGSAVVELLSLAPATGDALAARLGILGGLDLVGTKEQLGRLRTAVRRGGQVAEMIELLVLLRSTPDGLFAELRRLPTAGLPRSANVTAETLERGYTFGNYKVLGELGRGSQGTVYRAEHVMLEKPVAVKVLHAEFARDPVFAAQFVMEARAACRARHPSIVDVTDFGTLPDGRSFYVMELIEDSTLFSLLARDGALPAQRALWIARQVVDALRAASQQGVVHRDVKPANIFVDGDDRARLGDFGLARTSELATPTAPGEVVGTVYYMAPELIDGAPADVRSDIYALGCVLYEMLCGRVPFGGATLWEIIAAHATASPPPLVAPEGALPTSVEHVVRRAMARRPEERYQRPDEMLADLDTALRSLQRGGWRRWLPS